MFHFPRPLSIGPWLAAFGALVTLTPVFPQAIPDPFRPPPASMASAPQSAGGQPGAEAGVPQARIVLTSPGRKFAIVDGQTIRVGETFSGFKLLSIGPDGLLWQKGSSKAKTSMSPSVQKSSPGSKQRQVAAKSAP